MADKKGKPAEECYLTFKDFEEIDQTGDRPEIMIHVIKTLTGINVASQPDTIKEEP
jgi:Ca2+-binding EF-hand superfamily protein